MKIRPFFSFLSLIFIFAMGLLISCAGDKQLQVTSTAFDYSGYIIVASVANDSTGSPGVISLFAPDGTFVRTLYDLLQPQYASGIGFFGLNELFVMIESIEELEIFNLDTKARRVIFSDTTALSAAPIKQIAVSSADRSVFVVENNLNSIEKFTPNSAGVYQRVGAPFILGSGGGCNLDNPWGIAYIPTTGQIAVANVNDGGGVSVYNPNGTCAFGVATTPFNVNAPVAVAYHALSNKLIVALSSNSAIYAMNMDGTGIQLIYQDTAYIFTPRSIATDSSGYVYISNSSRDTIEKLYYTGQGLATRPLRAPLIGPRGFSSNGLQIVVIP